MGTIFNGQNHPSLPPFVKPPTPNPYPQRQTNRRPKLSKSKQATPTGQHYPPFTSVEEMKIMK